MKFKKEHHKIISNKARSYTLKIAFIILMLGNWLRASGQIEFFLEKLPEYPLKTIYGFCQFDTNKVVYKNVFSYDEQKRLIQHSKFFEGEEISRILFTYTPGGLLQSKSFYSHRDNFQQPTTWLFEYDENAKLVIERYDGPRADETIRSYVYDKNGLLITYMIKGPNKKIYSFKYDKQNQLVERYMNEQLEFSYEYNNGLLIKETQHNGFRKNHKFMYVYNDKGQLDYKEDDGELAEECFYTNGQLFKKKTYHFSGDDTSFEMPCFSGYVFEYEYY